MAKTIVKFGVNDFVQGGLLNDADVTFTNCRFGLTPPNYGQELPAFYAELVADDGTISEQFWSCGGKGTDLSPSEDGKHLTTESGITIKKECNFYRLLDAFNKLGMDVADGVTDATKFNGVRAHMTRQQSQSRGKVQVNQATGQPLEVLLPTEILGKSKSKPGVKAASAPGAAATANNGASVDPDAIHAAAVETLKKIIEGMKPDSTMTLNALKVKATQVLIASPHKTIRDQVVPQLINPEWLANNAPEYGAGMDDQDKLYKPE